MPDALPWDQFERQHAINPDSPNPVNILGAGLAGCWMARTLAEAGVPVIVLEAGAHPATAASSNPAGIVKPFITRSPNLTMSFYVEAFSYLLKQLDDWGLGEPCQFSPVGVVQLVDKSYPESEHYKNVSAAKMAGELGVSCKGQGLLFRQAGWLNPSALCFGLLQHPLIKLQTNTRVKTFTQLDDHSWRLTKSDDSVVTTKHVVLSTGTLLNGFNQSRKLCITPARGQISRFELKPDANLLERVVNGKNYIIPDGNSVLVGATFERDATDDKVRAKDNLTNLDGLSNTLNSLDIKPEAIEAFAGVRATTPDRLPLVGPLPDMEKIDEVYSDLHHGRKLHMYPPLPVLKGAYVLGGLGSRGIITAPFAAKLLADYMQGGHAIAPWSPIINPARFQIRALKRR